MATDLYAYLIQWQKEEVWANCDRCESQGEIILDELDDQSRR